MDTVGKTTRVLGVAFLLQFVTSFTSGVILKPAWYVPGDIGETMRKIADNPLLFSSTILLDMLTALGVIFLGVMLYFTLRRQSEKMALVALGFYLLEAALLAASRLEAFSLLRISQEYATTANPVYLTLGSLAYGSMDFVGNTLHMLAFCFGGILFYYLLYTSGVIPRVLSLWGLVAVLPMLVGTLAQVFGSSIPFAFYVPYVPFEPVIGLWILFKGVQEAGQRPSSPRLAPQGG